VPAGAGDELPPSLPAVRLDQTAEVGDGVTASIASLDAIDAEAHGPGNIGGPALRVGIRLVNGTGAAISLDGVSINMTYGPDLTPASPVNDPSTSMFTGSLAPGDSAEAVTVFTVPRDSRDTVSVTVGYRPGAPLVVFTGTAP